MRGAVRAGLQFAAGQHLDLVGAALWNMVTPLRNGLWLTAQRLGQFCSPTKVVNCILFLHFHHLVRFTFESKRKAR